MNTSESHPFLLGMEAVASVVASNESYDTILGRKLDKPEYQLLHRGGLEEKRLEAISILAKDIRQPYYKAVHWPTNVTIHGWAKTENNRKEFVHFLEILKKGFGEVAIANVAEIPLVNGKVSADISWILKFVETYYRSAERISASLVHQHRQYISAYRALKNDLSNLRSQAPLLAFVANDHSPLPVAFATAMRELQVPLIYFQHAEVTSTFPPLRFDYNVLRNKVSKEIYLKKERTTGRIYIVERKTSGKFDANTAGANAASLSRSELAPLVVIYLTAIFRLDYLNRLLGALQGNKRIKEIRLKPHPGTSPDLMRLVAQSHGDILTDKKPDGFHVAIVGNSSVVTELLREGNCVWQDFGLDDITADYYGYVARGLVLPITSEEVSGPFWSRAKVSDQWLERFADIDPSATEYSSSAAALDEIRLVDDLSDVLLDQHSAAAIRRRNAIRRLLLHFPRTYLAGLAEGIAHGCSGASALKEAQRLFDERAPRLISMLNRMTPGAATTDLALWLMFKRMEWTGHRPSPEEQAKLDRNVYDLVGDPPSIETLENMLLNDILRARDVARLATFWKRARYVGSEALHITRRIALMRWLQDEQGSLPGVDRASLRAGLSGLHQLKIEVQGMDAEARYSHAQLEDKLFKYAPAGVKRDLEESVLPVYADLRQAMLFMDVSRNDVQLMSLKKLLLEKIGTQQPFSVIRLSDGEGYIFHNKRQFFSQSDVLNRERHWWGEELPSAVRDRLLCRLEAAVEDADVLGIPSIYRFLRDITDKSVGLRQSVPGRGLLQVLSGVRDWGSKGVSFADDKVNLALFRNRAILLELVLAARRVVVVSSAQISELEELFADAAEVHFVSVPTHFKTSENVKYFKHEKPLPYHLDRINEEIAQMVVPGTLCLVAAGVAGKAILGGAKTAGAVALDVGSVLDEWLSAGIHSLH